MQKCSKSVNSICKAEKQAEIAMQEAPNKREAEEVQIAAEREVDLKRITAACNVENQNIQKSQIIQQA